MRKLPRTRRQHLKRIKRVDLAVAWAVESCHNIGDSGPNVRDPLRMRRETCSQEIFSVQDPIADLQELHHLILRD